MVSDTIRRAPVALAGDAGPGRFGHFATVGGRGNTAARVLGELLPGSPLRSPGVPAALCPGRQRAGRRPHRLCAEARLGLCGRVLLLRQTGKAAVRERVWQSVRTSGVAVSLKKKNN